MNLSGSVTQGDRYPLQMQHIILCRKTFVSKKILNLFHLHTGFHAQHLLLTGVYCPRNIPLIPSETITKHMNTPPLNSIQIEGFRSIRKTTVSFGRINILLGANGSGKSNFLGIFNLLKAIAEQNIQLYIDLNGGANAVFHYGTKTTREIKINLIIGEKEYSCSLLADNNDSAILNTQSLAEPVPGEILTCQPGLKTIFSSTPLEKKEPEIDLFKLEVRELLSPLILYHFHDTGSHSPMKRVCDIDETRYLFPDGANLAAFLYHIKNTAPENYKHIITVITVVHPEFKDFVFTLTKDGNTVRMRWKDKNSEHYTFPIASISDGTLRFIALATLLLQPEPLKLIIIDDPELGLHPSAVNTLADLIHIASSTSQIIISTQSPGLVTNFSPEDILIAETRNGATDIIRPDSQELQDWLEDYTLGEIWQKNLMGGNP